MSDSAESRRDLVIIGGGVAGLVTASVAGQLGLKVTLVERAQVLGGDCLNHGCVPSKTLIRSAKVASLMRRAGEYGLTAHEPEVDLKRVMDHVREVIATIAVHDDPERFRGYGCEVLLGEQPRFVDPGTLEVDGRHIRARRFLIATGSSPMVPPVEGLAEAGYVTNETVFDLETLPQRLTVLGGGPIGLEMAQAFARLGSEVTVIEMAERIAVREDGEISEALTEVLRREGITLHTGVKVERVSRDGDACVVQGSGGITVTADRILVAAGRKPNIDGLGLERAGVEYTRTGITTDRRLRTSNKRIFAAGDVVGPYAFTHVAEYHAGIVIANAIFRVPKKLDYRVVPWVTYTDPEVARVGLTEAEAREQGLDVDIMRFDFSDVDRAITDVETAGMVKLVARKGQLLGASLIGPHAGELLHELVLAMQARVPISKISAAIHAYPTLAQVHRRAVNSHYSPKLFAPRTLKLVKWINRLLP